MTNKKQKAKQRRAQTQQQEEENTQAEKSLKEICEEVLCDSLTVDTCLECLVSAVPVMSGLRRLPSGAGRPTQRSRAKGGRREVCGGA